MLIRPLFSASPKKPQPTQPDLPPHIRSTQQQAIKPIDEKFSQWGEVLQNEPVRNASRAFGTLYFLAKHLQSKPDIAEFKIKRQTNIAEALYWLKVFLDRSKLTIPTLTRIQMGNKQQLFIVRHSDTQGTTTLLRALLNPPQPIASSFLVKKSKAQPLTLTSDGIWNLGERVFIQRSIDRRSDVTFYGPSKGTQDIAVFHGDSKESHDKNLNILEAMLEAEPRLYNVPILFPLEYGQVAVLHAKDPYGFSVLRRALEPQEEPRGCLAGPSGGSQQ